MSSDVARAALRVAAVLEQGNIGYAIGGALALGIWTEPRGTKDVDIAVFLGEDRLEELFRLLEAGGASVERDVCRTQLQRSGYFDVAVDDIRVDVFLPDFALYDWAYPRRRKIEFGGGEVWFWAPEDVILFKLLFFREKDQLDIKSLVQVQGKGLDLDYIRRALREIFREDRLTRWFEETVRELLPGPP